MAEEKWFFRKKCWVWRYIREFKESNIKNSRILYNPETGVGEFYYNVRKDSPINVAGTQKKLGPILKQIFGTNRYICYIGESTRSNKGEYYCCEVQFYFKSNELPSCMQEAREAVENNMVFQEYLGTDKNTGETECFTYYELPKEKYLRYKIIDICEGTKLTKNGELRSVVGRYWEFA